MTPPASHPDPSLANPATNTRPAFHSSRAATASASTAAVSSSANGSTNRPRNLLAPGLSRRPPSHHPLASGVAEHQHLQLHPLSGAAASVTAARRAGGIAGLDGAFDATGAPGRNGERSAGEIGEIIVRDERGVAKVDRPAGMAMPKDEDEEEREAQNQVIESYRMHRDVEPNAALKGALQGSLQSKLASLDDDKWMFEGDDGLEP